MYIAVSARDYEAERLLGNMLNEIDAEWILEDGMFYIDNVFEVETRLKSTIVKVFGYADMTEWTIKLSKDDFDYFGIYAESGRKRGLSYNE